MQLTLGPYVVQIWSRNTLELKGDETLVLHRVVCKKWELRSRLTRAVCPDLQPPVTPGNEEMIVE